MRKRPARFWRGMFYGFAVQALGMALAFVDINMPMAIQVMTVMFLVGAGGFILLVTLDSYRCL